MEEREDKMKDRILQEINDALEEYKWGGSYDTMVVRLVFKGQYNLQPVEVDPKIKRKPIF